MELFFAKLLGLYFIVISLAVLARRKAVMPAIRELAQNRALLLVMSVIEIAAGLALVIAYPQVGTDLPGIISLVGYMMAVEGVLYLILPAKQVQKFIGMFNRPEWYTVGGVLALIAGLWLASVGFGVSL